MRLTKNRIGTLALPQDSSYRQDAFELLLIFDWSTYLLNYLLRNELHMVCLTIIHTSEMNKIETRIDLQL